MDQNIEPTDPKVLQSPSNGARSRMRMLCRASLVWSHFLRRAAAHPGSSLGRAFVGKFFKSDNARAALLAVGIAAFFALALHDTEYRRGHQTSVPGCDGNLCSKPVADAAPPTGNAVETPNIKAVQNDDKPRRPAQSAKSNMPPGVIISRKTGARAHVGTAHAARFQAYVDDLESNHGARIFFMGGIRPGHCSSSGMHPCGKALDVCQLSRGVVDSRCHLPPRRALAQIASAHGLFEGGRWCDSDYGHAQLGVSARDCGDRRTRIAGR